MTSDPSRRTMIAAGMALAAALATRAVAAPRQAARVIVDNDFAGDPDGLFQLAHHLLCPSVAIPLIVGSHLPAAFGGPRSAGEAASKARRLLEVMGLSDRPTLLAGAERSMASGTTSPATAAIVTEAMREDAVPLVYAAGAGLTELALAWRAEPRIARRLRLVWIGGNEHPGLAVPPPGPAEAEFNLSIDPVAAQVIFNESDIEIWQVPRDAYRQMLVSTAELDEIVETGPLGAFLKGELDGMAAKLASIPRLPLPTVTDAYVMGDSPLVTLTALVAPIQPDPSSSRYVRMPTPILAKDGTYRANPRGRPMRVYTAIDAGLTVRDMAARFRRAARR